MVGDHIYLNIGGIFSLKPFNLTGIAGGLLFISLSFDEPLLKQYNKNRHNQVIIPVYKLIFSCHCEAASVYSAYIDHGHESFLVYIEDRCPYTVYALVTYNTDNNV